MENKPWALITGASSGIGYAIAKKLDAQGYQSVLVARRRDRLTELKQELQQRCEICTADLREKSEMHKVFEFCQTQGIVLDLLVNNAGFGHNGEFKDEPLDVAQEMIQVNIMALVTLTKLFLPQMMAARHGRIVQISSAASFFAGPLMANYYATKAYVTSFSRALDYEVRSYGMGVTTICPGPVKTEFGRVAKAGSSRILKKNVTTASDIAEFTFKAIRKKKVVAIHGGAISFMIGLSRFLPGSWVIRLTALLNKTKPKLTLDGKELPQ